MPMTQATLAVTLEGETLHHPASLHATLTTQADNAMSILSATATWLRCACNHLSTKAKSTSNSNSRRRRWRSMAKRCKSRNSEDERKEKEANCEADTDIDSDKSES